MELSKVTFLAEAGVAYITLNQPKSLNVMDAALQRELAKCLCACEHDPATRVVVVQAEGKAFSCGGDIRGMLSELEKPPDAPATLDEGLGRAGAISRQIRTIKKPVVAAMNGIVAGAAASIALMCDFRIAAEDMVLAEAFVKIGLMTDGGGIYILNKLLGAAKTTELVMLGHTVHAGDALRLGLVTEVVARSELRAATRAFAEKLAHGPCKTYGYMKALVNQAAFPEMGSALETELEYQKICARSEDCLEGMRAYVEKRPAAFRGC